MSDVLTELQDGLFMISLNRVGKHNAFDENLLKALHEALDEGHHHPKVRLVILRANGQHFSAGADLAWMQRMINLSEEDNVKDALSLARLMFKLHNSLKPTLALVQGAAFGGGAGLVCACDLAIAGTTAKFCFSEVKLGLIPAVVSPYVVKAIGERAAKWLFMTAETIDGLQAKQLGLVQHCVADEELSSFGLDYAKQILDHAPLAVSESKQLVSNVALQPITEDLLHYTAKLIAKKRVSQEGQKGLQAFLDKKTPKWT